MFVYKNNFDIIVLHFIKLNTKSYQISFICPLPLNWRRKINKYPMFCSRQRDVNVGGKSSGMGKSPFECGSSCVNMRKQVRRRKSIRVCVWFQWYGVLRDSMSADEVWFCGGDELIRAVVRIVLIFHTAVRFSFEGHCSRPLSLHSLRFSLTLAIRTYIHTHSIT